jgi:hypothetical protein
MVTGQTSAMWLLLAFPVFCAVCDFIAWLLEPTETKSYEGELGDRTW